MFYSQFILAKKGPLGTIWIAAHLERKLRKNQVADTDIGVSVDSILSPDVPIALRLSSHLLLGVVRIYSKKVNYLFDDCSEALLKVKQAFRSTVVDLPPEESKAPYHSITLPETFDLDDFELPDTEVFQGNFVDHHVSTKEQITLQDTMDGVVYSTSQFGLDERFGDGDASQIALDLDEELLLNKGPSGHGVLLTSRADPQTCVEPSSSQRSDELDEEMRDTSQDVGTNCLIEAGSPSTAQPMEIGVSSDIAHLSGKDNVFEPSTDPNPDIDQNGTFGKSELDGDLAEKYSEECGEAKEIGLNESIVSEQTDHSREKSTVNGFYLLSENLSFVDQSLEPAIEAEDKLDTKSNAENKEGKDLTGLEASEFATEDAKLDMSSAYEPLLQPCNFPNNQENTELDNLVSMPNDFGIGSEEIPGMQDAPEVSVAKVQSCSIEAEGKLGNNSNAESEGQDLIRQEASEVAIVDPKADMLSVCKPMLEPCNIPSSQENAELINLVNMPKDVGIGSEEISRMQDAPEISVVEVEDVRNQNLNKDHSNMAGQPVISENILSQKGNDSVAPELPSPEKMLSLPDVPVSQSNDLLVEITPGRDVLTQGDQDATINKISGKKRSLTESTITLQSQNSVDTSEAAQSKRSVNFVPDDDDLLSSILVGRRSTVLKVKSTPPVLDLVPSKRPRVTPRSGAHKRKVLVDDSMVLHGDTIRQQLLNTEDIRRVRKKAPSTHPEIWILQKRCLEDEMFHVPILTGFSPKLISLHCQPYDLSEAKLIQDDGSKAQSIANDTILTPKRLTVDDETEFEGICVSSVPRDENGLHSAVCPFDTPAEQSMRVSSELFGNTLENEMMTNSEVGHTPLHFDFSENRTEIGTECRSPRIGDDTMTNSEVGRTPLQFDISENRTEMETECRREAIDDENNHPVGFGIESSSCFPCASQNDTDLVNDDIIQPSSSKDINDADFSKQVDGSCLKLDEQSSGKDPSLIVDTSIEGIHFGEGVEAAFREIVENGPEEGFLDVGRLEDADSFVPVVGAQEECSLPVNDENTTAEDRISDEGRIHELGTENKDEFQQSDLNYDEQREDFKLDPSDPAGDVFDHDTDFLNFDDDEIAEDDENTIPNAEGPQILDNSGWSTRTRAVANYLQVLFHKEAQHGRTVLRLDNLLVNKSRKEASRMFFETLVLKTRDYINVDQEVPFGNINIKPRARLLKSEF